MTFNEQAWFPPHPMEVLLLLTLTLYILNKLDNRF